MRDEALDAALSTFFDESRELLTLMDDTLRALLGKADEGGDALDAQEALHALFRAAHTIKGSAGMFALDEVVRFTHAVESLLSLLRDGALAADNALLTLLLDCHDHLEDLIAQARGDLPDEGGMPARGQDLMQQLQTRLDSPDQPSQAVAPATPGPDAPTDAMPARQVLVAAPVPLERVEADTWHVSLRLARGVLRDGMDPISFLRYLNTLGRVAHITTLHDDLPDAEAMDPLDCYLGFEVELESMRDKADIQAVFDFLGDTCQLRILPPHSRIADYVELIHALPEGPQRLGEILIAAGALTRAELALGLAQQHAAADSADGAAPPPLGEILIADGMAHMPVVEAALDKQQALSRRANAATNTGNATTARDKPGDAQFVRVHAAKLDQLIDLVGELVIAGDAALLQARDRRHRQAREAALSVKRLVEQVRDVTLKLRMVEIGEAFNRFHRVVRELGRELGKDIALDIAGADTELDKTMVEKLADPLMHLVRNAVDHGLETAEQRIAAGKPARGTLRLNAYHDSGGIVIEIGDDGRGLDGARILARARERGLVGEDDTPSDADIHALIFEPGFSTAANVTNVSGRGVGMDVVKKALTTLRGVIDIDTAPGQGTTLRLRLPLTLAIIDGFLVRVENVPFVLPLEAVFECVALGDDAPAGRQYTALRGEVLPYVKLRDLFALGGPPPRRQNIVVVRHGERRIGVVVDQLQGELQTVIKPLGRLFRAMQGLSGSSILGSGEVALILDVASLVRIAVSRHAAPGGTATLPYALSQET